MIRPTKIGGAVESRRPLGRCAAGAMIVVIGIGCASSSTTPTTAKPVTSSVPVAPPVAAPVIAPAIAKQPAVPATFQWTATAIPPIRVIPLNHRGEPTSCVADKIKRPCDLEVTAKGEFIQRSRNWGVTGLVGPGLTLKRPKDGEALFELRTAGELVGLGPFQEIDAAQVLFCRLTDEPALHCHHEVRPSIADRIWNETNCTESLIARVEGDAITITAASHPNVPPIKAARIEPAPVDDHAKALALFLMAVAIVDSDTDFHTPYVSDQKFPR